MADIANVAGASPEASADIGRAVGWGMALGVPALVYVATLISLSAVPQIRRMGTMGGLLSGGTAAIASGMVWILISILADVHPAGSAFALFAVFGVVGAIFMVTIFRPGS